MPLPRAVAKTNRVFLNKLMRPVARVAPGLGVLHHRGRTSGLEYQTPLNVLRDGDRLIVALTYGEDVDWLKNARAAGEAHFVMGGKTQKVGAPALVSTDEGMASLPAPVRALLKSLNVTGFVAFPVVD